MQAGRGRPRAQHRHRGLREDRRLPCGPREACYRWVYQIRNFAVTPPAGLPAAERRARIEDAAARLFAERGYAATSVEDIVREAGVSKPILYRHFESKRDLHAMLLERRRDELAAAPLDQLRPGRGRARRPAAGR